MTRWLQRIDRLQQRYPPLALLISVFKRFGEHKGAHLGTTIAYWSFFSIFPLMLAFVTILDIVLRNNPGTRQDVVESALGQIPVLGSSLRQEGLTGSWVALTAGVATAIWTGMAAGSALQDSLDQVWDVPIRDRPNTVVKRLRVLGFLVLVAVGITVSTLALNVTEFLDVGPFVGVAGYVLTFAVNTAIVLATCWLLTSGDRDLKVHVPGAVVIGVVLTVLQSVGGAIARNYIAGASDTYGTFAVVIALLSYFFLISRVFLLGSELNAVLAHGLSPRSLLTDTPLTDGDRRASEHDADRIQRDPRLDVHIDTAVT
ncbi:N/A [soil metagenome]